jgi:hypothetical protein
VTNAEAEGNDGAIEPHGHSNRILDKVIKYYKKIRKKNLEAIFDILKEKQSSSAKENS